MPTQVSLKERGETHTDIWRKRQFGDQGPHAENMGRTHFSLGATRGSKACHHFDFGLSSLEPYEVSVLSHQICSNLLQ